MNKKKFYPVIHILSEGQALLNAEKAIEAGADGIFLIHHRAKHHTVFRVANQIHQTFPNLWMGVNLLNLMPQEALEATIVYGPFCSALWVDDGGVWVHNNAFNTAGAAVLRSQAQMPTRMWNGKIFGGFAFKYQPPIPYGMLSRGAELASSYMDTITTSGDGTGMAADLHRLGEIRKGAGSHRVGIASGITPENIDSYLPLVDDFLVASGISDNFHELNFEKTHEIAVKISQYNDQ